jgi:hypothetical protein
MGVIDFPHIFGLADYEEMSFKVKVHGPTTDGHRTKCDHKGSPCHFVTGELKINDPGRANFVQLS